MPHFVVLSVNTARENPKRRFESQVNDHLAKGYKFLGDPQSDGVGWVAFMIKEEGSA